MKKLLPLLFIVVCVVLVGCETDRMSSNESNHFLPEQTSSTYYVYMSPIGNDGGNGSIFSPLATLYGVQLFLQRNHYPGDVVVRARSDQGMYLNLLTTWTYYNTNYNITFESYPDSLYAIFHMENSLYANSPFFNLTVSSGLPTNIHFRKWSVSNYTYGGIWFTGIANDESKWNGYNSITDCIFKNIGNIREPNARMCYGVVNLVNTRYNMIKNCSFFDCANLNVGLFPQPLTSEPDTSLLPLDDTKLPIIAVYIAFHSVNNTITQNSFRDIKGDGIRIKDESNDNTISYNHAVKTGWTGFCTMWYCHPVDCNNTMPECPSYNNWLYSNRVDGNWMCGPARMFKDMRPEEKAGCTIPQGAKRIWIFNNVSNRCTPNEDTERENKNFEKKELM
jgi:hypothetical protein